MISNSNQVPRTLGNGFGKGYEFIIDGKEPNQGLINAFPFEKKGAAVSAWINGYRNQKITDILDDHTLGQMVPDLLVNIDLTQLRKLRLPENLYPLFSKSEYFDRLAPRFIATLRVSFPQLSAETIPRLLIASGCDELKQKEDYLLAYLIPALLDVMDQNDRDRAAREIALLLKPKHFLPLADPEYFKLKMTSVPQAFNWEDNKRTRIFRPIAESEGTTIEFRGKKYVLNHLHIHFELDGEEKEYLLPFLKAAGEVHIVFHRIPKHPEKKPPMAKKFIAVAVPLTIGAHNEEIEKIISSSMPEIDVRKIFLKSLESPYLHAWGSLFSSDFPFNSGLYFNICKDPLAITLAQYEKLKIKQMDELDPSKVLYPIDRKAHRRIHYV